MAAAGRGQAHYVLIDAVGLLYVVIDAVGLLNVLIDAMGLLLITASKGAQWLSGRVLDSRPRGSGFEPYRGHCVVVLEQDTFILAKYWFNPGRPVPV